MRYTVAALALAGAAMAGEGYPAYPEYDTKSADPYTPPAYPTSYADPYPTSYDPYPTDYPTSTKKDDPAYPYPTYDPAYPTYPTSSKKDDAYPTTSCSDEYDVKTKEHIYTTSTIYVTKGHEVKTVETVYPVYTKTAYPEKPEKEYDTYKPKPTYPASKYPEKETEKAKPTAPACPTYSVKTIHTSVTTVVPTILYETVSVPCSTYKPYPTGAPNATYPKYPVTAGAGNLAVSGLVAAAAGLVAAAFL